MFIPSRTIAVLPLILLMIPLSGRHVRSVKAASGSTASGFWGAYMTEICDNAIDDDLDGLIDLNDTDCICVVIEPESLIPNPSFEEMNCCPANRSQLDCASVWIQASEPTTDYLHTCGWMGWPDFPPPLPFPDGEGIMGFRDGRVIQNSAETNWKEYAGACLLGPLEANTPYRFEFYVGFVDAIRSPSINISFFGTSSCDNLPFGVGNDAFGCPTNGPGWQKLGGRLIGTPGNSTWVKASITVTPGQDIHAIAIGPDCNPTLSDRSTYYFFDNLVLDDLRSFEFQITELDHPCSKNLSLMVPREADLAYQWYKEGVALTDEKDNVLSAMYGEGKYQVRVTNNEVCNTTKPFIYRIPEIIDERKVTICAEETYSFGLVDLTVSGSYIDTFLSRDGCDSIVMLSLDVLGQTTTTTTAKIFEGETFRLGQNRYRKPGNYMATLTSKMGCDSLVDLNLSYYHVYFPTIFSPNGDGQNDRFTISGAKDLIEIKSMIIYDRWGKEVYKGQDFNINDQLDWDGRFEGRPVNLGVYTYIAELLMDDGIQRQFSGSVMLLR